MRAVVSKLSQTGSGPEAVVRAEPGLPPAVPLSRALVEIAAAWSTGQRAARRDDDLAATSPEALQSLSDDLALATTYRSARVIDLGKSDFPCIVLLKSGQARILTERRGPRIYRGLHDGMAYDIAEAILSAEEAGTVFLPRPRTGASAESGDSAKPRASGLIAALAGHMFRTSRTAVAHLMVTAALGNLLLIAMPLFSMAVYDRVIPHGAKETLWALAIGVFLALLLDFALRYVRLKLADALAISSGMWLQAALFRHLTDIEMRVAPRNAGSFAMQMREADAVAQLLPQVLPGILIDLPFLIVVLAVLGGLAGPVAFVPVAGLALLVAVQWGMDAMGRGAARHAASLARQQTSLVVDTVGELESVKAAACEPHMMARFERLGDEAAYLGHVGRLWASLGAYSNVFIGQAIVVAVMVFSVYQIGDGLMTVGALSAASLLVGRMIGPVGQLVSLWHRARQVTESLDGLEAFLAKSGEQAGREGIATPVPTTGAVALKNVQFAYPGTALNRLQDVSLTIAPGEKVAIIGRSGSGKSTLLKMLVRLHSPDRGTVLYGGSNIAQMSPRALRGALGYMRQEPSLLDDTLLANITMGAAPRETAIFDMACRVSGVTDFAARHPDGFGMRVGPRGECLSGGERQSVTLARLLYREPSVLILDEPTSSMDTILEARVVRDLKTAIGDRTLILSTHRAPLLTLVDRLIWLEEGRVVADGPKAEILVKMNGQGR